MSPAEPSGAPSSRGDLRRDAILTALDERLRTTALDDISVADLTVAAGITRSAFYFYFESKAAAVTTLLAVIHTESLAFTNTIISCEGDFRSRTRTALERLVDQVMENEHIYRALLTARTQHEPTREMWNKARTTFATSVAEFIRAERDAGRAPEGVDASLLAEAALQINEALLERVVYAPDAPREPLFVTCADMWARSIYGRLDREIEAGSISPVADLAAVDTAS